MATVRVNGSDHEIGEITCTTDEINASAYVNKGALLEYINHIYEVWGRNEQYMTAISHVRHTGSKLQFIFVDYTIDEDSRRELILSLLKQAATVFGERQHREETLSTAKETEESGPNRSPRRRKLKYRNDEQEKLRRRSTS